MDSHFAYRVLVFISSYREIHPKQGALELCIAIGKEFSLSPTDSFQVLKDICYMLESPIIMGLINYYKEHE